MKIQLIIESDVSDSLTSRSPIMRIIKILSGDSQTSAMKWYVANKDKILEESKEKTRVYNEVKKAKQSETKDHPKVTFSDKPEETFISFT
jgi:hypothetical protein